MTNKMKQFFAYYRLPILAGFLTGTSYIPFPPWTLFICLVPLFLFCVENTNPKKVWTAAWISQFIFTLIGSHWIAHTAHEFGHLPWIVSIIILLGYCVFANIHIPAALWAWSLLNRKIGLTKGASLFAIVALFTLSEMNYPAIFPWNFGYPWLWYKMEGYQWADVIGFQGLSSITLGANAVMTYAWLSRRRPQRAVAMVAALVLAFVIFNKTGALHAQAWSNTDQQLKIIAVQPNIGNFEKEYARSGRNYQHSILAQLVSQSEAALVHNPEADLVIWPETAYPDILDPDLRKRELSEKLFAFIRRSNVGLLTGAFSGELSSKKEYNGMFLFDKQAELTAPPYRKSILLAFGEYFPLGEYFPMLYTYIPAVSNFGRGNGPTTFNFGTTPLGPQICYEGLYSSFAAEQALKGARVLVNLTNDSWFGTSFEPYQHLYITLSRGIETRRPVVRITNTGISTVMLASGEVQEQSPLQKEWAHSYVVSYQSSPDLTLYSQYHQWHVVFWLVFLVIVLVLNRHGKTRHT